MKIRYSKYLRYIFLLIDLLIINLVTFLVLKNQNIENYLLVYLTIFWFISSIITKFYSIQRFTGFLKLMRLIFVQLSVFILGYFAYFGIFKEGNIINSQFNNISLISIGILCVKTLSFFSLKKYRTLGNNYRNVIFIGLDDTSKRIVKLFKNKRDLGYKYLGFFDDKHKERSSHLGEIKHYTNFIENNTIHEIYASISILKKEQIKFLIQTANANNITVKLIPDANEFYSKHQEIEFYNDTFQILKVKKLAFEYLENKILKRIFDVIFSFLVIVFLMSWLTPILWILIKLESKGPLFFKQEREGLNGKNFICYKFRSMKKNTLSDKVQATKNDTRITKIGKFIRKTSIDELPQFYNVFFGDMSVVGPRPHMNAHNEKFTNEISNYIKRNRVKPGITGLAQVKGYRGEIKKKSDIENRVRLDIFYIENWSFSFDIKIIIKTVTNIFKGEVNAY